MPVGAPLADGWMATLNVTDCPNIAGFRLDATVAVAVAPLMICVTGTDVLAEKLPSPLYFAVMECDPADRLASESCAELLETVAAPKDVAPSRNVTVPVA